MKSWLNLGEIERKGEGGIFLLPHGDPNAGVFSWHPSVGWGVNGTFGYGNLLFDDFVSVRFGESVKELDVVVKESMSGVTGDWELVIHDPAYFSEVVNHGEAIHLVNDVLGITAVGHKVKLSPFRSDRVGVEIESGRVSYDVEGEIFNALSYPEVSGFAEAVDAEQVLVSEVAYTQNFKLCDEVDVGLTDTHVVLLSKKQEGAGD